MCPIRRTPPKSCCSLRDIEDFAALARALGHPHRLAILGCLREHNTCICGEIVDLLPVAQSTVSQHLKKLKEAGWIKGEIEGPRTCYCLNEEAFLRFRELAETLLQTGGVADPMPHHHKKEHP
jgi:ArsR family transcriptional regulator, arsenate/arsenite/antimonite-responsive transcriptional repressor